MYLACFSTATNWNALNFLTFHFIFLLLCLKNHYLWYELSRLQQFGTALTARRSLSCEFLSGKLTICGKETLAITFVLYKL